MKKLITKTIGTSINALSYVSPATTGRLGFKLFCYPVRLKLKPHQHEFLETAEKFSFDYKNKPVQGYRWGNGPKKILFVHGWQSHSFRWKNYIQALSKEEYTLYALDAPGHGLSAGSYLSVPHYSDMLQQFISSTGKMDTVVSHSIGSFSMMHALYLNPSLAVERLVVMGAPGEADDFIQLYQQTLQISERALQQMLKHFEKVAQKPVSYFSSSRFAPSLQLPGLIIHDREDAEAPYAYAVQTHKAWKNSQLLTTQGFTHNLRSPEVVEAVVKYIKEGLPQATDVEKKPQAEVEQGVRQ